MKRHVALALLGLLGLAVPLFAQQPPQPRVQLFGFISDPSIVSSQRAGTSFDAGFGFGVTKFITPRYAAELSVASHDFHEYASTSSGISLRHTSHVYPLSLDGQYHFLTGSRWKPYAGLGLRYIAAPHDGLVAYSDRLGVELNGGVSYLMTPRLSVRVDGKQELPTGSELRFDPRTRVSFGLGWHF